LLLMLLMSTSQFKLPHYQNILFPLFAIITGKSISRFIYQKNSLPKWITISLYVISILYFLLGLLLNTWAFPVESILLIFVAVAAVIILAVIIFRRKKFSLKPVFITLITVGIVNFFLNANFFPHVLAYQGSSTLAEYVNRNNISNENVSSFTSRRYYSFDVYIKKDTPEPSLQEIKQRALSHESFYIITDKLKLPELKIADISIQTIKAVPDFHVSKLNGKFINPKTRLSSLDSMMLIKVN
jgi:hypothetical protein